MKYLIIFTLIAIAISIDTDGAYAARISPQFSGVEQALTAAPEYRFIGDNPSIVCKPRIDTGATTLWYSDKFLCARNKNGDVSVFMGIDKKVNKSKEVKARFQYNLNDGQTLYRNYVMFPDKSYGDVLFLIHDEDVTEFLRLSKRSAMVIVTYNASLDESGVSFFPM